MDEYAKLLVSEFDWHEIIDIDLTSILGVQEYMEHDLELIRKINFWNTLKKKPRKIDEIGKTSYKKRFRGFYYCGCNLHGNM